MNEIVIYPDGTRQIVGNEAHKLAFGPMKDQIFEDTKNGRFCVYEGDVLKASQSTVRAAYSYMQPERVLVYRH